jgi:hypothetical protein
MVPLLTPWQDTGMVLVVPLTPGPAETLILITLLHPILS